MTGYETPKLRRRPRRKSAIIPSLRPLRLLFLWGLALANVVVQLVGGACRVTSDNTGHFRIPAVAPGDYVLNVSTAGYHLVTRPLLRPPCARIRLLLYSIGHLNIVR